MSRDASHSLPGKAVFVATVENHFVERRGRGVQWSPADYGHAERWHALGMPLGLALQVLDARMKAWQFKHGGDVPAHLGFYEPAILHACKHLTRTGRSTEQHAEAAPALLRLLDGLPPLIAAAVEHPVRKRAYGQAFDLIDGALREGAPEPDEDALVGKVRASMLRIARQGLDEAGEAELQRVLMTTPALGMSKRARAAQEALLIERWLCAHNDLCLPGPRGWQRAAEEACP
jgi:hypothetical protein